MGFKFTFTTARAAHEKLHLKGQPISYFPVYTFDDVNAKLDRPFSTGCQRLLYFLGPNVTFVDFQFK